MPNQAQIQKGELFRKLHAGPDLLLMPNAWNPGSARMLAAAGFSAIATTSAGIAFSFGLPDYEGRLSRERMLEAIRQIAAALDLPVSADLEAGYGASPEQVAETIALAIDAGVVGGNIEDYCSDTDTLYDAALAVDRIRAARAAADGTGIPFTLTARTDCYLAHVAHPFAEAVRRANAFREAGADCLFVPGVNDVKTIAALAREIDGPLNIVMGFTGNHLSVGDLHALRVKRVSIGGSLARATYGLIRRAAQEMRETGTFHYADGQIPDAELSKFFAAWGED